MFFPERIHEEFLYSLNWKWADNCTRKNSSGAVYNSSYSHLCYPFHWNEFFSQRFNKYTNTGNRHRPGKRNFKKTQGNGVPINPCMSLSDHDMNGEGQRTCVMWDIFAVCLDLK